MNIILIAPPAAGKGTQSARICDKFATEHVSTGDLIRNIIKENSPLGNEIKEKMNKGLFIDNDLILKLISKKLDEDKSFIFDGFPRNIEQAKKFDELLIEKNKHIDYVLYLKIDKELAKKRIVGRLVCPNCNGVYNFGLDNAQEIPNCQKCNEKLIKRQDDTEETFENRFNIYEKETSPIISYYKEKGILYEVDSSLSSDKVFEQIEGIINND